LRFDLPCYRSQKYAAEKLKKGESFPLKSKTDGLQVAVTLMQAFPYVNAKICGFVAI
jgi:hypothetical protein